MYSMRCNGCRPGECPGGRDNFGYCLTTTGTTDPNTPTCAANEMHFRNQFSGDLAREGCRPKTCPTPNGRNMFTGNCRACPDPLNYHNGTTCVPALGGDTISSRLCGPSGILHMGTGFMYNGYNNCIEINCSNGRNPTTGRCETTTTTPPEQPEITLPPGDTTTTTPTSTTTPSGKPDHPQNVTVSAYTDTVKSTSHGVATVRWSEPDASEGIDGHRVHYISWNKGRLRQIPPDNVWIEFPFPEDNNSLTTADNPITGNSYVIPRLQLKRAYMVQVQAFDNDRAPGQRDSAWSPIVYFYPTSGEVETGRDRNGLPEVGDPITVPSMSIPLEGYSPAYTYYVCKNRLPDPPPPERPDLPLPDYNRAAYRQIRDGIGEWAKVIDILNVNANIKNCTESEWSWSLTTDNLVTISDDLDTIQRLCSRKILTWAAGSGCVGRPVTQALLGYPPDLIHIIIATGTPYQTPPNHCSQMYRVAMHEAGHVYGLHHGRAKPGFGDYSVMWMPNDSLCTLTEHDIFAINIVYLRQHVTARRG